MGDITKIDQKYEEHNNRRKSDFNKKLLGGDFNTLKKFLSICVPIDDEDSDIIKTKIDSIINIITEQFDIETIKMLDCKLVPFELFQLISYSKFVNKLYELGECVNEDRDIIFLPNLLELSDGSEIKLLLILDDLINDSEDNALTDDYNEDDE